MCGFYWATLCYVPVPKYVHTDCENEWRWYFGYKHHLRSFSQSVWHPPFLLRQVAYRMITERASDDQTSRKSWRCSFCRKALQSSKLTRLRSELLDGKFLSGPNYTKFREDTVIEDSNKCFRFSTRCSFSALGWVQRTWSRKSKPYFALTTPVKIRRGMRNDWVPYSTRIWDITSDILMARMRSASREISCLLKKYQKQNRSSTYVKFEKVITFCGSRLQRMYRTRAEASRIGHR